MLKVADDYTVYQSFGSELKKISAHDGDADLSRRPVARQVLNDDTEIAKLDTNDQVPETVEDVMFPEGGWQAWTVIFSGWLLQYTTFGLVNAFGVFNDFYVREYLNNMSSSDIGWIGSLQVAFFLGTAGFAGPFFDKGYLRHLVISGSLVFILCSFMLSLTSPHQYYQVLLSHGLGIGLGTGLVYLPSVGVVSHYFKRKAPLVLGIVSTGGSVGAVLHPIMINKLIYSVGFHNAIRINAGMNTGLLIIANLTIKTRLPPRTYPKHLWRKLLFDLPYGLALIGVVMMQLGLYFPIFFIQLNAVLHKVDSDLALNTVSIIQGASTLGRILPLLTLKYIRLPYLLSFCLLGSAILVFSFVAVTDLTGTVCFAILYGFFSGTCLSLIPAITGMFATDVSEVGVRIGTGLLVGSLGALVGLPIDGALLTRGRSGEVVFLWWRPSVFSGVILSASALVFSVSYIIFMARRQTK